MNPYFSRNNATVALLPPGRRALFPVVITTHCHSPHGGEAGDALAEEGAAGGDALLIGACDVRGERVGDSEVSFVFFFSWLSARDERDLLESKKINKKIAHIKTK